MNIISGFCSVMEWCRSVVFDAGTQGLGLDANNDEMPIPPDSCYLLPEVVPSSVRAVTDLARAILHGDFVAMSEIFNAHEGLPPLASLECPYKGRLLKALEKKLRGEFQVQVLVLQFLQPRDILKLTMDQPSGWGSYQIDDRLAYVGFPLKDSHFKDSHFKVIDRNVWFKRFKKEDLEKYGLSVGLPPVLQDLKALRALNQLASIPVENNAGFTFMTIPDGLTLNKLIALAAKPQPGHQPAVIDCLYRPIATQHGDIPVEGGVVAISNGLLVGSRNKSVQEQSALVASHGCQMPQMVDVVALCFLTYINSSAIATEPVLLLNDNPWRFTRCIDQIAVQRRSYNLVVGGFTPAGLLVCNVLGVDEDFGVCALRKF